jgi:hypothetical protein
MAHAFKFARVDLALTVIWAIPHNKVDRKKRLARINHQFANCVRRWIVFAAMDSSFLAGPHWPCTARPHCAVGAATAPGGVLCAGARRHSNFPTSDGAALNRRVWSQLNNCAVAGPPRAYIAGTARCRIEKTRFRRCAQPHRRGPGDSLVPRSLRLSRYDSASRWNHVNINIQNGF